MKKSQSSDYINGLEKTLGIDKEGNLTIGKNLEVGGTTKLNGGIEPIHIYRFRQKNHQYELHVYEEKVWNSGHWYNFFGLLIDEIGRAHV